MDVTNCRDMLFSREKSRRVSEIKAFSPGRRFFEVPTTSDLLDGDLGLRHYPFTKTFAEAEDEVAFIIHSPGTTGMRTGGIIYRGLFIDKPFL